jgi:hypothetical protein
MNNHIARKSFWFAVGLGAGAGATWLFGTRSGRRARRQIGHVFEDSRERLAQVGGDALDKGKRVYTRGREFLERTSAVGRGFRFAGR